jgi:hypothetical protein
LGKVAKGNLLGYGIKTLLAGVVSILIGSLFNSGKPALFVQPVNHPLSLQKRQAPTHI